MERNMLRYLFEGYADTIALATTLRPRPDRPAIRQVRRAPEFVEASGPAAPANCTRELSAETPPRERRRSRRDARGPVIAAPTDPIEF
jgi:hypothetical protein